MKLVQPAFGVETGEMIRVLVAHELSLEREVEPELR